MSYLYGRDCLGELRDDEWLYYLHDTTGHVRQGTDTQGQVTGAWLFDPDGTVLEGPNGPVSHLVCGGVYDQSTGLIYQNGRYFDPNLGIWLALTPLLVVQARKKKRGRYPAWVLLLCVSLGALGSLTACDGPDGIGLPPTPTLCVTVPPLPVGPSPTSWPSPVPATGTPSPVPTSSPTPDRGAPPGLGLLPPTNTPDLDEEDALARMLYGEQKHEPDPNIIAAGWTVRNRIAIGYRGLYTYKAQVETGEYQGIITPQQRDTLPPTERQYFEDTSLVIARGVIDGTIDNSMKEKSVPDAIFFSNTSSIAQGIAYEALLNDAEGPVGPENWGEFESRLPDTRFFFYRNKAGIYPTAIPVP